jgi:hypothetical protein
VVEDAVLEGQNPDPVVNAENDLDRGAPDAARPMPDDRQGNQPAGQRQPRRPFD